MIGSQPYQHQLAVVARGDGHLLMSTSDQSHEVGLTPVFL
jgi:hypothetical protein